MCCGGKLEPTLTFGPLGNLISTSVYTSVGVLLDGVLLEFYRFFWIE